MGTKISEEERERIIKLMNWKGETINQEVDPDLFTPKIKNKFFLDILKGLYPYYYYSNKSKSLVLNLIKKIDYELLPQKNKEVLDLIVNQIEQEEGGKIEKLLGQIPNESNIIDHIYFNNLVLLNKILDEIFLKKSFFEYHIEMFELYKNKFTRIEFLTKYFLKKKEFEKLCQNYNTLIKVTPFKFMSEPKRELELKKELIKVVDPIKKMTSMFERKYRSFINNNKMEWEKIVNTYVQSIAYKIYKFDYDELFKKTDKANKVPSFISKKRICRICEKEFRRDYPGGSLICGPCTRKKRKDTQDKYFKMDEIPKDIQSIIIQARKFTNEYAAEYIHRDDVKERKRKENEVPILDYKAGGRKKYLAGKK